MFAINLDIDWAPDGVVEYALDLLAEYGIRATLFCTHKMGAGTRGHELCIHPNFLKGLGEEETLDEIRALFPYAAGVRAHASYFNYYLCGLYKKKGLLFDSSYYFPSGPVKPWRTFFGLMEIPYFFGDDLFVNSGCAEPDLSDAPDSVKVFLFHPVHLFINTNTTERYLEAKPYYMDTSKLDGFRREGWGATAFFRKLLETARDKNIATVTMGEVYERFIQI
jgi:hypothetical protein